MPKVHMIILTLTSGASVAIYCRLVELTRLLRQSWKAGQWRPHLQCTRTSLTTAAVSIRTQLVPGLVDMLCASLDSVPKTENSIGRSQTRGILIGVRRAISELRGVA